MAKRNFEKIQCKVLLTPEEIEEAADTLAAKTLELDDIEVQKKASNAGFKEKAERISGEIRTASRLYRDKFDMRDVECEIVKDYEAGVVQYVRQDTYEIVKRVAMSQAERQMHIDELLEKQEREGEVVAVEFQDGDRTVTLTPGKKSGSDGGAGKTEEELRKERETKRLMTSEKSVH
jgi:hypothetical protein